MLHFEATLDPELTQAFTSMSLHTLRSPQTQAGHLTVYLSVSRGICMLVKLLA